MLKIALATFFISIPALAVDAELAGLMDPTAPSPAQSVSRASDMPTETAPRLSLGIGTGVNTFGGNMGKLYSKSSPVMELRGEWALSPIFSVRLAGDLAKFGFNAAPNGAVNVSTQSLQAAARIHALQTAFIRGGLDPYISVGSGHVWRSQEFSDHNQIEKDSAAVVNAGIGTGYVFTGSKLGLFAEADAGQIFFQDRRESQYLESGLEDLSGLFYSARLGVKYVF